MWVWSAATAAATTFTVGPQGDFDSLEEAVAAVVDGDIIEIDPGIYPVDLEVEVGITLRGAGPGLTRLTPASKKQSETVEIESRLPVTVADLTIDGGGTMRPVEIHLTEAVLDNVTFELAGPAAVGASIHIDDSEVTMRGCTFAQAAAVTNDGGHMFVLDSIVTLDGCTFDRGLAADDGGAIRIVDSDATILGSTFTNCQADSGGAIDAQNGAANLVVLRDNLFELNAATSADGKADDGFGGAAIVFGGQAIIEGNTFRSNTASLGGGALDLTALNDSRVAFNRFEGNEADEGGAVAIYNPHDVSIVANTMVNQTATRHGGGVYVGGNGTYEIVGNAFCDNAAEMGGAVLSNGWSGRLAGTLRHNVASEQHATLQGGTFLFWVSDVEVAQNTIVDSATAQGAVWVGSASTANLRNNVFVGNGGGPIYAPQTNVAASFNLFWMNETTVSDVTGIFPILEDPGFTDASQVCGGYAAPANSPLIDAGDPKVLDDDGTRSDLGAYGGPGASLVHDLDGDGVIEGDCAPYDAKLTEATTEVVGDGLDQDCDGLDLCYVDGDGDGVGSKELLVGDCTDTGLASTSGDCDDADPSRIEDCTSGEDPLQTQDTGDPSDGPGTSASLPGTWFCATGPGGVGSGTGAVSMAMVWLVVRRRRSSRGWRSPGSPSECEGAAT